MRRFCFTLLLCAPIALAQAPEGTGNPVSDTARRIFQGQQKNVIAAAEQMPADKYDYKPTPQQNSFGHVVSHVIGSNYFICARFNDSTPPANDTLPKDTDAKDKLVAALKQSIDWCNSAMAGVTDGKLGDQVAFYGGRKVARAQALFSLTIDFADHYGALAQYLRLNGMLPPTAQPRPAQPAAGTQKPPTQ